MHIRNPPILVRFFLSALLVLPPVMNTAFCRAASQAEQLPESQDAVTAEPAGEDKAIDKTQQKASKMLFDAAEWFDSFFDDNRYYSELNESQAKLKLSLKYTEDGDLDLSPRIRWRIHLPKLSKKTNLILFASEDEEDDFGTSGSEDSWESVRSKDDFGAAVQQFLKRGEKYNISTTFGASTSYVYGGIRFRYFKDFGPWQGRFVERLRYYTDDGWENLVSVDMERQISSFWLFRSSASLYWYKDTDNLPHNLSFRLYQSLSKRRAISYEWDNRFITDPSHKLSDIQLQLRYRQQFYRDWLLYELKPRVNFPEENDREAEYSVFLILEAKFGHEAAREIRDVFRF